MPIRMLSRVLALVMAFAWFASASASVAVEPPEVGEKAKDFKLKTPAGEEVSLADSLDSGPTVILLLRGYPGYQCPICSRQIGEFIAKSEEFKSAGASVIMIYPGPRDGLGERAGEFVADQELPKNFSLVLDPDYSFTRSYGLRWDAPRETAYPSTFVVAKDGKVAFAKVSKTHGDRTTPAEVLEVLKKAR